MLVSDGKTVGLKQGFVGKETCRSGWTVFLAASAVCVSLSCFLRAVWYGISFGKNQIWKL